MVSHSYYKLLLSALLVFHPAQIVEATTVSACPSATSFDELVSCFLDSDHMPGKASNGFVVPEDSDLENWYSAVWDMLTIASSSSPDCGNLTLRGNLGSLYEYASFVDGTTTYCVLSEMALVGEIDKKGWGTFITRLNPRRNLHFQVPHPLYDLNTGTQNANIFAETNASSLLLTGTHRNANTALSSCQGGGNGDYKESDAAHNIRHMFHSTTKAVKDWHDEFAGTNFVVLQLHGFGSTTCTTNMYMTYGRPTAPSSGDCLKTLQNNLHDNLADDVISVPGELARECRMNGASNTQGRLLNGVDHSQVCAGIPSSFSGRFIHVEQEPHFRRSASYTQGIIDALTTTFPTGEECGSKPPGKQSGKDNSQRTPSLRTRKFGPGE